MENTPTLLCNAQLVLPERVEKADLLIESGRISQISGVISPRPGDRALDLGGKYVLPGFIDIHNHGSRGFDCSLGLWNNDQKGFILEESTYQEGLAAALRYYVQNGTTRVFHTSLAAPLEDLEFSFRQIKSFSEDEGHPLREVIGGINLEGTFLKLPAYAGAQSPEFFFPPTPATFDRLQEAAGGLIRIVNLPPEHGAEGLDLIRRLRRQGVLVAAGHTGAEADAFMLAVEAGTRLAVHFFNGPSRSSSKSFHDGGAEEAMLRSDEISLELIVDGYHVHPAYVRDAIARKGVERIVLITDSMFISGCTDIRAFQLCGVPGMVSENRKYLQVTGKADTLFGSVLTARRGFENVLNWLTRERTGIWHRRHEALKLEEALVAASRMASGNPARLTGIGSADEKSLPGTGTLERGNWADLIVAEVSRGGEGFQFTIHDVFLKGARC